MFRQLAALLLGLALTQPAVAGSSTITVTPGAGATYDVITDGSGNFVGEQGICDATAAAHCASVNASGQLGITGPVTNAGTFAVQATLQASGSTAIGKVDPNTIATWGLAAVTQNVAAPTNGLLGLCQFTTSPATISTTNVSPIQCDSANNVLVKVSNTNANITPADGAANPTTTSPVIAFLEAYNGSTWDRLTDDANKYLQVNVKTATVSGQADPCFAGTKVNLPISQNGTASVQLVGVSGSTTIYVCSLFLMTNSTATTAALTTGTGTACVTNNAAVIGTTTANIANSMNLIAGAGFTYGNGSGYVAKGAASSELCLILGSNVYVSGNLTYVQQ